MSNKNKDFKNTKSLRRRMKKNNLKAMIFQLNENNQSELRYQQFVQFIKRFNRSDIKIGLILPNPTKNFSPKN